jgi:hypothetical protein
VVHLSDADAVLGAFDGEAQLFDVDIAAGNFVPLLKTWDNLNGTKRWEVLQVMV